MIVPSEETSRINPESTAVTEPTTESDSQTSCSTVSIASQVAAPSVPYPGACFDLAALADVAISENQKHGYGLLLLYM